MSVASFEHHEVIASNASNESSHFTPDNGAKNHSDPRIELRRHDEELLGSSSSSLQLAKLSSLNINSLPPPGGVSNAMASFSSEKNAATNGSTAVAIKVPTPSQSVDLSTPPQRGEGSEVPSEDEEYFEEFHLPNTGENTFIRHQSFRRKVQITDIDAPDADRIEGLVRTGDFYRHDSIRKKIVPEEVVHELEEEFDPDSPEFSESLSRNIEEIQNLIDATDESNFDISHGQRLSPPVGICPNHASTPYMRKGSIDLPSQCSIPIDISLAESETNIASEIDYALQLSDSNDEFLTIEQSTIKKIQDCLDYSNYNDIYNLSGRLQDILSPKEIEEVLSNSERYSELINFDILEMLSMSLHESSKGNETANTDSGFSSPKPPEISKVPECKASSSSRLPNYSEPEVLDRLEEVVVGYEEESNYETEVPNKLKKIPAPAIDLNSSSDVDGDPYINDTIEESEISSSISPIENIPFEDSSPEVEPLPKKKLTFNKTFLSSSNGDQSTEYFPSDTDESCIQQPSPSIEVAIEAFSPDEGAAGGGPPFFESLPPHPPPDLIPELTAAEEFAEERHWRNVVIGGSWRRIDMKVIAPYRKCITHGGYSSENMIPIIVLSSSLLPEKSRRDYHYVMDNLFMYMLSFLEHLASDDYVLVYLAGGKNKDCEPGFHWMRKAYQMIDRRIRKNLRELLVVHPTMWARALIALSRPFISSKFYRKLHFVFNLTELAQLIPLEQLEIPESVKQVDFELMIREKKRAQANRR